MEYWNRFKALCGSAFNEFNAWLEGLGSPLLKLAVLMGIGFFLLIVLSIVSKWLIILGIVLIAWYFIKKEPGAKP